MKLIFMGTPEFSVPTLRALHVAGHEIIAVYTQPPRRAGRGKREQKSAVHKAADALGLPVKTPDSLKGPVRQQEFSALGADCAVVIAYGQILSQAVLDAPRFGCINVHASLLPRWRGAAPIHRAVMAGDSETGVCIMQMEAGLDTGPVLMSARIGITDRSTTQDLHDKLADLGASLINGVLDDIESGTATPVPQQDVGVTYAHKIDKAEARIDWSASAVQVDRQVRGLFLFPGAWTTIEGGRVKILSGRPFDQNEDKVKPGTTLTDELLVACGSGSYQIETAQRAGKSAGSREDFLRGFPVCAGTPLV